MNNQYKKIFSVLFAILVGASIVFLAWKGGAPVSTKIENNNEWRDSLKVVPQKNVLRTIGLSNANLPSDTRVSTTTTDLVSRLLLVEYTESQKRRPTSAINDLEAQNIATKLAQEVRLPENRIYSISDINVSTDNSLSAGATYTKELEILLKEHTEAEHKETELTILMSAMETKNTVTLNKLQGKALAYKKLIEKLLALKTPSVLAPFHLRFIQSYETLRSGTVGLQSMLADPVIGLAALAEYRSGIDDLSVIEQWLINFKTANNL